MPTETPIGEFERGNNPAIETLRPGVGDVVIHKVGGPKMMIDAIDTISDQGECVCLYFDSRGVVHHQLFRRRDLRLYVPPWHPGEPIPDAPPMSRRAKTVRWLVLIAIAAGLVLLQLLWGGEFNV